ncbi:hypothetical protein LTR10_008958 [Elasticomyces elasticus]|nr:hypothetical protein LTR10_008958 [Elasticomyces elasticus]KAK4964812.1 hypothetical protein LTR42_012759 [Elasticomyces elasticus]
MSDKSEASSVSLHPGRCLTASQKPCTALRKHCKLIQHRAGIRPTSFLDLVSPTRPGRPSLPKPSKHLSVLRDAVRKHKTRSKVLAGQRKPSKSVGPPYSNVVETAIRPWKPTSDPEEDVGELQENSEERLKEKVAKLEGRIRKLQRTNEEHRRKWLETAHEVNRLQSCPTDTLPDAYFSNEWAVLRYSISAWCQTFDRRILFWRGQGSFLKVLSSLAYKPKRWLNRPFYRHLLLQAYVWDLLLKFVFDGKGFAWAGPVSEGLRDVHNNLKRAAYGHRGSEPSSFNPKDFHQWRTSTAIAFKKSAPFEDLINERADELQDKILNHLRSFAHNFDAGMKQELRAIIEHSVRIDLDFQTQLAVFRPVRLKPYMYGGPLFSVSPPDEQSEIYGEYMRAARTDRVHLVVVPGLCRYGGANSKGYNQCEYLKRCQVYVYDPPGQTAEPQRSNAVRHPRKDTNSSERKTHGSPMKEER